MPAPVDQLSHVAITRRSWSAPGSVFRHPAGSARSATGPEAPTPDVPEHAGGRDLRDREVLVEVVDGVRDGRGRTLRSRLVELREHEGENFSFRPLRQL